jgi:hypothetical protein
VVVLGKVIKLAEPFLNDDNEWLNSLKYAYRAEKKNTYFKVPVLPKKGALMMKADLLSLDDGLGMNIYHEIVRRKKWTMVTKGIPAEAAVYFFQPDCTGQTPFRNIIKNAPFDVIMCMWDADFDVEDVKTDYTPNRNIFHEAVTNKELSQAQLLEFLKVTIDRIGDELLTTEVPPLLTYIQFLSVRTRKNKKILKEVSVIMDVVRTLTREFKFHGDIVRSICTLDESIFDSVLGVCGWINWFGPSFVYDVETDKKNMAKLKNEDLLRLSDRRH